MNLPQHYGPYELTLSEIDRNVKKGSIGAYSLGPPHKEGGISPKRIGRSDDDLNKRLKDYVGQYPQFVVRFCSSIRQAYETECYLWHKHHPVDNKLHPDKPAGTNYPCPECGG